MRKMIWISSKAHIGWTCSECAWEFDSLRPADGKTIQEVQQNFERERDEEFAAHVCAEHPRTKSQQA